MKKILMLSALVVFFGVSTEAFGQRRVRDGVRSGRITREEARILRAQRREIRRDRRQYRRQARRDDWRDDDRRRGDGYYRRGAGSARHPVFGVDGRRSRRDRRDRRWWR